MKRSTYYLSLICIAMSMLVVIILLCDSINAYNERKKTNNNIFVYDVIDTVSAEEKFIKVRNDFSDFLRIVNQNDATVYDYKYFTITDSFYVNYDIAKESNNIFVSYAPILMSVLNEVDVDKELKTENQRTLLITEYTYKMYLECFEGIEGLFPETIIDGEKYYIVYEVGGDINNKNIELKLSKFLYENNIYYAVTDLYINNEFVKTYTFKLEYNKSHTKFHSIDIPELYQ